MIRKASIFSLLLIFGLVEGWQRDVRQKIYTEADFQEFYKSMATKGSKFFTPPFLADAPVVELYVGDPLKKYLLNIETGSNSLWFYGSSYPYLSPYSRVYDPTQSRTSQSTGNHEDDYSGVYRLYGPQYIENFFYDKTQWNQTIGVVQTIINDDSNITLPLDGIFGAAWKVDEDFENLSEKSSPILFLLKNETEKILSIYQQRLFVPGLGIVYTSIVGRGGFSTYFCDPDITYVPLNYSPDKTTLLSFNLQGFAVGKYAQQKDSIAKVDTGVSLIYVPNAVYNAIYRQLTLEYDPVLNLLLTDCSNAETFPDWVFTVGGRDFVLTAKDYLMELLSPANKCVVPFDLSQGNFFVDFLLGNAFLRTYCSIYDIPNNKLGLSKAVPEIITIVTPTPDPTI